MNPKHQGITVTTVPDHGTGCNRQQACCNRQRGSLYQTAGQVVTDRCQVVTDSGAGCNRQRGRLDHMKYFRKFLDFGLCQFTMFNYFNFDVRIFGLF